MSVKQKSVHVIITKSKYGDFSSRTDTNLENLTDVTWNKTENVLKTQHKNKRIILLKLQLYHLIASLA